MIERVVQRSSRPDQFHTGQNVNGSDTTPTSSGLGMGLTTTYYRMGSGVTPALPDHRRRNRIIRAIARRMQRCRGTSLVEEFSSSPDNDNDLSPGPTEEEANDNEFYRLPVYREEDGGGVSFLQNPTQCTHLERPSAIKKVVEESQKYLPIIFGHLNWNELHPLRLVCQRWLYVISSTSQQTGTIVIRDHIWRQQFQRLNDSLVTWTKYRIEANVIVDLVDTVQLKFWSTHGPHMRSLEMNVKSLTVTGLLEILARCPNLTRLQVRWTPHLYKFNAEMVRRHSNGTFVMGQLREFGVDASCYMTNTALETFFKWFKCGIESLSLRYPRQPEEGQMLTRLKPRWSIQAIKTHSQNLRSLKKLDFSWSHFSSTDLRMLADIEDLNSLGELLLNYCNGIDDKALNYYFQHKGQSLERLEVAGLQVTEAMFANVKTKDLANMKTLNISGEEGSFRNLEFLKSTPELRELTASDTLWLDYEKLASFLTFGHKTWGNSFKLKTLDMSGKYFPVEASKKNEKDQLWFTSLATALSCANVVNLNLSKWSEEHGSNENVRVLCCKIPRLQELRLEGWIHLTDSGITGTSSQGNMDDTLDIKSKDRVHIGLLKKLTILDLSGSSITDTAITHGISSLTQLRKFAFANTLISDEGVNSLIKGNLTVDTINWAGCKKITNKISLVRDDGRKVFAEIF